MTLHICRDLVLGVGAGAATGSYDTMWALTVFMQGVLGYQAQSQRGNLVAPSYVDFTVNYFSYSGGSTLTQVSSSIISIHSASCFITASGGHTLLQFSTDTVNLLSAAYPVGWASGSGAWPGFALGSLTLAGGFGDPFAGTWVAIKSTTNPKVNSGIFQIINSTLWLSGNAVEIDYRTTSPTVQETTNLVTCSLWLPPPGSDSHVNGIIPAGSGSFYGIERGLARTGAWPYQGSPQLWVSNGNANGYQGNGSSTYPRLIMTSPHSTAYQVRVAIETPQDAAFGGVNTQTAVLTAIPGFSGSSGDFQTGSFAADEAVYNLHAPQWINYSYANAQTYAGDMPIFDYFRNTNDTVHTPIQYRFYAWGDDSTGTVLALIRNVTNTQDALVAFGFPENEEQPTPPLTIQRLFAYGCQVQNVGIDWNNGFRNGDGFLGMTYSLERWRGPIPCCASQYVYVAVQQNNAGSIRFDAAAGDTPFLQGSELLTVDLTAGTYPNTYIYNAGDVFPIEPRRMGQFPFARFGRATGMSSWTADTSLMWLHAGNGFYVPWGGVVAL